MVDKISGSSLAGDKFQAPVKLDFLLQNTKGLHSKIVPSINLRGDDEGLCGSGADNHEYNAGNNHFW
jgi:hypothetical protein